MAVRFCPELTDFRGNLSSCRRISEGTELLLRYTFRIRRLCRDAHSLSGFPIRGT